MGCDTSTKGDVYSYGIIILEMFLGKQPIDKMFKDGLNLHNYAMMTMAQPERLLQIVDAILLIGVEEMPTTTVNREDNNENEIEANEEIHGIVSLCQIVRKCLVPILQLGLACSVQSPKERMNMEKVTRELH